MNCITQNDLSKNSQARVYEISTERKDGPGRLEVLNPIPQTLQESCCTALLLLAHEPSSRATILSDEPGAKTGVVKTLLCVVRTRMRVVKILTCVVNMLPGEVKTLTHVVKIPTCEVKMLT